MTGMQPFILALIFLAVAGIPLALYSFVTQRPLRSRLQQLAAGPEAAFDENTNPWRQRIVAALSPAGKLSLPEGGWENSPFRQRFMHAGYRGGNAPIVFFGIKTVLALALPVVFLLAAGIGRLALGLNAGLITILLLAALGFYLPNVFLRWQIARRQRDIFESFPDAIDLMTVAVEAGLGLDAAIARVGNEIGGRSGALEEELRLVGLELRAGASRQQALRNLALRTGVDEIDLLVSMLVQSDRFGTGMAESLRVHSDSLRTKRRLRAEEAAAKIPLKMLFPLIFCIFPALMIVLLGPSVISIYRVFSRVAAGQ